MTRRSSRRRLQQGYTLVELMMAISIFLVSALGIVSMQRVATASQAHAKNLAIAQRIAQSTASQLELDATLWTGLGITGTWLTPDAQWRRLPYVNERSFGSAFNALGNPLNDSSAAELAQARFCSNVRVSWLFPTTMGRAGNGVVRAEIRVFWRRDGATLVNSSTFCSENAAVLAQIAQSPDVYQFVYQTVALRQHSQI